MRKARTTARRFAVAGAAVAALVVAGCNGGSADPSEKQWEGDSQSQSDTSGTSDESASKDKGGEQGSGGEKGKDGSSDGKTVIRGGDANEPDADTKAAAEAFIGKYLKAQNAATKDGDFSQVDPMIESCQICSSSRANIKDIYERGGKVEGSLFTEPKISAGVKNPDGSVSVSVVATISAYTVTDASGAEVDGGGAEKQTYQYSVAKQGGEWKIVSGRFVG